MQSTGWLQYTLEFNLNVEKSILIWYKLLGEFFEKKYKRL